MAAARSPQPTDRERALRARLPRAPRPRLAASLIVYRGGANNFEVLMGRRNANQDFMPSIYVFPGGQVERADSYAPFIGSLSARAASILSRDLGRSRIEAPVLAAIRETFEETGLMLGTVQDWPRQPNDESWKLFSLARITPDISNISLIGRAITPPNRHKRFDTWFFAMPYEDNNSTVLDSDELTDVGWHSAKGYGQLKTHHITDFMFETFQRSLTMPQNSAPILLSRMVRGTYEVGPYPEPD